MKLEEIIDYLEELDTQFNCQEDLKDWLVRNWEEVEEDIRKTVNNTLKENTLDLSDSVDRDVLIDEISENLQQGLFNVINTFNEV